MPPLPISVTLDLALACVFWPAQGFLAPGRLAVLIALDAAILLTPLLIPPEARFGRFLGSVLAIAMAVKLYDLHLGAIRGRLPDARATFVFLINLTAVVERKLASEPRPGRAASLRRLGAMLAAMVPGIAMSWAAWHVEWRGIPFAVEHLAKTFSFFLVAFPAGCAGAALWRVLGQPAHEPMDDPLLAFSPADFWRRYNRIASQFFLEDVFKPLGGMRHPVRATLASFFVSGIVHEYLFVIAVGRVQGYQLALFAIQGIASAATLRFRPRGWSRVFAVLATLAFNLATARLFFASFDEIGPFYERR